MIPARYYAGGYRLNYAKDKTTQYDALSPGYPPHKSRQKPLGR